MDLESTNLNESTSTDCSKTRVSGSLLSEIMGEIRKSFADYKSTEGCGCCRNDAANEEAEKRLGILLDAKQYDDGSGFDWSVYRSRQ